VLRRISDTDIFKLSTGFTYAEALERQNFTIDRRKIHLAEPIKQLGQFPVQVKLHRDVTAEIQVSVVPEAE
jgi:large subunit ribosomal protein L9